MSERQQHALRTLTFDIEGRAATDATIPVVVSTDAIVEVADGPEILVHTADAVDLQRAPLPIIATHRGGQVNVGLVDNLRLINGQMRGEARFGERQEAAEYKRDVLTGIIRAVSAGYARIKATVRSDGVLVTTRWMPTHVAMVAEPADVRAGFFRAAPAFEIETQPAQIERAVPEPAAAAASPGVPIMADPQAAAGVNNAEPVATLPAQPRQGPTAVDMENERVATIRSLCDAFKVDEGVRNLWITSGTSTRVVSDEILAIQRQRAEQTPKVTQIGLSAAETRRFSIARAIDACASQNWTGAGLEAEASREIQRRLGRNTSPNRFFVPWEVQERQNMTPLEHLAYSAVKRDLTVASAGAGGYLKDVQNVGFIELLRNKSVLYNMGAQRMPGLVGDVSIPKQSATGSATWLANEASTISEINQTFVQIALSPKNVGGYTEISRQLLLQSSPAIEGLVMADLAAVVALDIDLKGINGSGASGQPTGILNTSGVGSVTGASLDFADIVEFMTDVFSGNALTGNSGYVTTGTVAGLLKARVKASNTWSPIWEGRLDEGVIDGYRAMASNQMPSGTMLFGDFGLGVVIGEWGVLEMEVNPYANFQAGIVGVRAIASVDIGVRYPTAFSAASSVT